MGVDSFGFFLRILKAITVRKVGKLDFISFKSILSKGIVKKRISKSQWEKIIAKPERGLGPKFIRNFVN